MAYSIRKFRDKFLAKIDKEGSELYSAEVIMEFLETATYNYIEQLIKYNENTQLLRDALLPIYKPLTINLGANISNPEEVTGALPSDFFTLDVIQVVVPNVKVRKTDLIRKGELFVRNINPNKKASPEYPLVIEYSNTIAVYTGDNSATQVKGFYICKPTFGDATLNLDTEIAINLDDRVLEQIMNIMVNIVNSKEGDPRYQTSMIEKQTFGKN